MVRLLLSIKPIIDCSERFLTLRPSPYNLPVKTVIGPRVPVPYMTHTDHTGHVHGEATYLPGYTGRHIGRVHTHQGTQGGHIEGYIPTRVPPRTGRGLYIYPPGCLPGRE